MYFFYTCNTWAPVTLTGSMLCSSIEKITKCLSTFYRRLFRCVGTLFVEANVGLWFSSRRLASEQWWYRPPLEKSSEPSTTKTRLEFLPLRCGEECQVSTEVPRCRSRPRVRGQVERESAGNAFVDTSFPASKIHHRCSQQRLIRTVKIPEHGAVLDMDEISYSVYVRL